MANFIGAIVGANSGMIYAIINPDNDVELDNPRLLLLKRIGDAEVMRMIRIPRDQYASALSQEDVANIVQTLG